MSIEFLKPISTQKAHKTYYKQGSILHYLGTNHIRLKRGRPIGLKYITLQKRRTQRKIGAPKEANIKQKAPTKAYGERKALTEACGEQEALVEAYNEQETPEEV